MSYDSIRMLEEARSHVMGGVYPPAPAYILRFFDITKNGTTWMIFSQDFMIIFSLCFLLKRWGMSTKKTFFVLLILVSSPTVIGCMLVLWKDVTLAAILIFASIIIYVATISDQNVKYYSLAKWSSLILIFSATLIRFNAITATIVLLAYWLVVFNKHSNLKKQLIYFLLITSSIFFADKLINTYSFPTFKKLEATSNLTGAILANDLLGMSYWARVSLIPFDIKASKEEKKIPLETIDKIYSSLGAVVMGSNSTALGGVIRLYPSHYNLHDIYYAWFSTVLTHPIAYIQYRFDLFSEIIGAKNHPTYEPTHFNRIDENKFGIKIKDRYITNIVTQYIAKMSDIFLGKPWFIFILSLLAVVANLKNHTIDQPEKNLSLYTFLAALMYIMPFFIISGTGEVRYSFPAIILFYVPLVCYISSLYNNDMRVKNAC